jgi:hypothetical protein
VTLRQRVEDEIVSVIDQTAWDRAAAIERIEQESLADMLGNWRHGISGLATE